MAGAKDKKAQDKPKKSKFSLAMVLSVLSLLGLAGSAIALFGAGHSLVFVDLTHTLHGMEIAALGGIMFFGLLLFVAGRMHIGRIARQCDETVSAMQAKLSGDQSAIDQRIQTYLGGEMEKLKLENENLKASIAQMNEAVEREKEERRQAELDMLRQQNAELKEKFKNAGPVDAGAQAAAMEAVESAIAGETEAA